MRETASTVTSKGQVTIPAEVRRHLRVERGSRISFVIEADGSVRLRTPKYPNVASLVGAAGPLKEPLSWDEALQIAREGQLRGKYGQKG